MAEQISQIINPPPNEPQPDRDAQLDNDLSKLFESPPEDKSAIPQEVSKPSDNIPVVEKEVESPKDNQNKDKVPDKQNPEVDDLKTKPSKEGWKILRESHAKAKKTISEKDQELAKLKESLAERGQTTSKEFEALKKEAEELKSYRAMVDIQADPEFVSKFDEPIGKRTDQIAAMLTQWGVAKEIIEKIDYTDPALLVRIEDTIAENKDKISAKKFLRLAEEVNELYDKRTEHLEDYKKNYKTLLETKKKESFTKQAESEGRVQKRLHEISQLKDEKGETQFPFLNEMTVKDSANLGEVAQVERHNKAVTYLREKLDTALKAETPEDKADVAVAAVAAHWTSAQLKAAIKKIESLQLELSKISNASNETPKSQRTKVNHGSDKENLSLDDALSEARMNW